MNDLTGKYRGPTTNLYPYTSGPDAIKSKDGKRSKNARSKRTGEKKAGKEKEQPKNGRPKSVFARHGGQTNYSFRVWTRLLDLFGRVAGPNNSSAVLRHLMLRYIWENRNRLRSGKENPGVDSRT